VNTPFRQETLEQENTQAPSWIGGRLAVLAGSGLPPSEKRADKKVNPSPTTPAVIIPGGELRIWWATPWVAQASLAAPKHWRFLDRRRLLVRTYPFT